MTETLLLNVSLEGKTLELEKLLFTMHALEIDQNHFPFFSANYILIRETTHQDLKDGK